MGKLVRLDTYRHTKGPTFFDRGEFNKLIALYSRRVMTGEWRDYAVDQKSGMAIFSVFRHSHDRPLFTIIKRKLGQDGAEYLVFSGRQRLARTKVLDEALAVLGKPIRLVT